MIDKAKLKEIPGVYIFKDRQGQVLYVGKAVNLKRRILSYFQGRQTDLKVTLLAKKTAFLETIVVDSELEALILEANLIKKFLPPFNLRLADDKDYLYIKVTKGKYPQITTARKKELQGAQVYFGPFPSAKTVRTTLKKLRRVFPWCSSPLQKCFLDNGAPRDKRLKPCFYYHLGQCPGACVGKIDSQDYKKIVRNFINFMQGGKDKLLKELSGEMVGASEKWEFEKAARIKKVVEGINYLTQPTSIQSYLDNPNFMEKQREEGLKQLWQDLNLPKTPQRIEAYDISNIGGAYATGSCVVMAFGEVSQDDYRKFKIKIEEKSNDAAMMGSMIGRRLNHDEWPYPDLILVDGGVAQARVGYRELLQKGLTIPLFGIAKRMDWLYPPFGKVVKLERSRLSLRLIQKIRDEAHRVALSYHRHLRQKGMLFGV